VVLVGLHPFMKCQQFGDGLKNSKLLSVFSIETFSPSLSTKVKIQKFNYESQRRGISDADNGRDLISF